MMDLRAEKRIYPTHPAEYDLHEEIGHGANAVVYRAICKRFNSVVAIKCLDLEVYDSNLENVSKEARVMSLIDHPNVIRAYCSFVVDHFLWVVMPYMDGGSCLHIMKVAHPDGLEENVIATILKETLKALDYLHRQGHIHRDVKAGNVLIDANGCVKLGDFGVSAYLFSGDRQRSRKTFTGTPCWMAPEVMEQKRGYDYRADIWSFGITALELAHGHAPFSKFPPMKVLLMTIQSPPPSLDHERDKRFTKAFKEMLALCLQKEPSKRPTAERLLKHSFFKQAKSNDYIVQKLLNGLGPLWEREKILRFKDADLLAQKKTAYLEEEEISRNEYKRGVSCWNFDVETLQEQAASMQDVALVGSMRSENAIARSSFEKDGDQSSRSSPGFSSPVNSSRQNLNPVQPLTLDTHQLGPRRWSSVKEPKQIGRFGVFDGDLELESPGWQEIVRQTKYTEDQQEGNKLPTIAEDRAAKSMTDMSLISGEKDDASFDEKDIERGQLKTAAMEPAESVPFTEVRMPDSAGAGHSLFRSPLASNGSSEENNGGSLLEKSGSNTSLIDNRVLEASVQSSASSDSVGFDSSSLPISFLVPQLKSLLFQTAKQYETVASVIKAVSPAEDLNVPLDSNQNNTRGEGCNPTVTSMQSFNLDLVQDLQNKITSLTNEVASLKLRNVQLERQLNAIYNKQEEERIRREEAEKGYL